MRFGKNTRAGYAHTVLTPARIFCALFFLALPGAAFAHGFGRLYNLPVPFWLYGWGSAAALLLSFLIAAFFANSPAPTATEADASRDLMHMRWARALRAAMPALRVLGVFILLLCIATGLFGNRDPQRNFNMTFFWVIFTLGFAYLSAFFGNFYAALNPWRTLADFVDRLRPGFARGRFEYPADKFGDWPALALYLGFIWFELMGNSKPLAVAVALFSYTALNLVGVWLIGARAWFKHFEFFSLFLRLISLMAPLDYRRAEQPGDRSTLRWRAPFVGLITERPAHLSTVIFALAMLSTTAFDGLRATRLWVYFFWSDPYGFVRALAGDRPYALLAQMLPWYQAWETLWLFASPFIYLGVFWLFISLGRAVTRSKSSLRELALDFGLTIIPIALVYGMTHYATLMLTQGLKIVSLSSDPFGFGWNLFGSAQLLRAPILPPMRWVWHTQVGLILLGHVISVYLGHRVALRVFASRQQAMLSQLPTLWLMVCFTVSGLWILAQPLTMERMM